MSMKRYVACFFLAYLSYFALFSNYATLFIPVQHFGGAVFIVAAFLLYYRHEMLPGKKPELIFAGLLSVAYFTGISFSRYDSFALITASRFNALFSVVLLAGFLPFFYVTACFLAEKVLRLAFSPGTEGRLGNFLAPFCLLLLAWLPYFFIYFPGTLINDAVRQLSQFTGVDPFVNHHPIVSTFFMGAIFRLGLIFGGGNTGLVFITIVHNLMMAAAFSMALCYLKKWGCTYRMRMVVLAFFAFFPVFGIWAQTILKDTHSSAASLVFVLLYIDLVREYSRKNLILCIIAGVVASLFRNEVVFVVLPSMLALIFVHTQAKKRAYLLAAGFVIFISVRLIVGGAMAATDARPGSVREVLSVPFQQTARFMRCHEITEAERAVLAATFSEYHLLPEVYDPRISDPVKNRFTEGASLGEYFRIWAAMGRRAPLTYLEAAIAISFSYVVPFGPDWQIVWPDASHDAIPDLGRDDIGYVFFNREVRILPVRLLELAGRLPGFGLFLHTGNYTWAMAFLVLLLVKCHRFKEIFCFLPALMFILACMASPVHGFWRYYLPVLFMFPVLASYTLLQISGEKKPRANPSAS